MKEANPHLTDEVARHLTLHGTNWNADKSLIWKFDNYARGFPPYGHHYEDLQEITGQITMSGAVVLGDGKLDAGPGGGWADYFDSGLSIGEGGGGGHWVHHDQLGVFLEETKRFLAE